MDDIESASNLSSAINLSEIDDSGKDVGIIEEKSDEDSISN